jgi:hypothetical protein
MNPWKTNSPIPTEEELKIRDNAILSLREEKIVYKALRVIQDYLKEKGMIDAYLDIQIFPEFSEEVHKIRESIVGGNKGYIFGVTTNLHS